VRVFFVFNICLWVVLFLAWLPFVVMKGVADPTSTHVAFILTSTALLLTIQGFLRYRRIRSRVLVWSASRDRGASQTKSSARSV
jgi:hypothetical protein